MLLAPSMQPSLLDYVLWIAGSSSQAILAVRVIWTKLNRTLPVFFAYLVFHVVRTAVLLPLRANIKAYFVVYWSTAFLDDIVAIAVVNELYNELLARYDGLRALSRLLFRWAGGVLVLLAITSAATPYSSDFDRLMSGILIFDRAATIVQLGLLLFLFGFASLMRLTWRHYVFGIVLGFALFASVELVLLTMTIQGGALALRIYGTLKSIAFNCCALIWVVYLFGRDRVVTSHRPPRQQLEEWNRMLMEFMGR